MFQWLNRLKTSIQAKKDQLLFVDIRCRFGQHDFFDPTSEQPMDAWFMEDIQRFHEQHPIPKGHLCCKRCGKSEKRSVGTFFDAFPFMIIW